MRCMSGDHCSAGHVVKSSSKKRFNSCPIDSNCFPKVFLDELPKAGIAADLARFRPIVHEQFPQFTIST